MGKFLNEVKIILPLEHARREDGFLVELLKDFGLEFELKRS